jgi:hypothetical protein
MGMRKIRYVILLFFHYPDTSLDMSGREMLNDVMSKLRFLILIFIHFQYDDAMYDQVGL